MDPVYKSMHSFPCHVDQTHFGPYSLPGFEAAPTQIYVNPLRPQFNDERWPWGSNCCFAYPAAYHGCGNHNYVPNHYSWSSPYSSYVPPIHSTRSYHSFPFQYVPSPHYPMERPQYEYDKHGQRDNHCCGCPNHLCHPKEEQDVKIEEEEKHGQRIKIDSPDPFQLSKCPYPSLWLPPNDRPRKELLKTNPLDCRNLKEDSNDAKPFKNPNTFEQQPTVWNGWYPYDLNHLESFKKKGDDQHHEDEYKGQFPFPVFWMPYKPEEKIYNPEPRSELVKHSDGKNGEHTDDQASLRAKSTLSMEDEILRNNEKESEPVKVTIDNADQKFSRNDSKKNSSSPKSSNLPPVCLRVEPLTRGKNTNGKSRSLSPPGGKRKSGKTSNEPSEAVPLTRNGKTEKITHSELKKGEGITKIIEVVDGKNLQGEIVEVGTPVNLSLSSQRSISTKERNINGKCTETDTAVVKGQSEDAGSGKGENAEVGTKVVVLTDEANKPTKTELSKEEAAIVIQSAYRGFNVRRWEPVKKLKQIARVREQISVVNNLIQALELSTDIKSNSKQRNIIAETIMNLLLKLDTIQGLHHSIREVRKSAVRDLVNLQEKLDSLINENSEASPGLYRASETNEDALDVLTIQNVNETSSDMENVAAEMPENCVTEVTKSTSESTLKNEDDQSDEVHEDVKVSLSTSNLPLNSESGESEAINASMSDEAQDKPLEMKIPSQQDYHLKQEFSLINDSSNSDEASDIIEAEVVEGKSEHNGVESHKFSDQQGNAISNINNHIDVTDAQKLRLEQEISLPDDLANIDDTSDIIRTEMAEGKPDHDRIDSDKSSDQQENETNNMENHIDVIDAQECCLEPETSLVEDLENSDDASDMIGAEVAGGKSEHDGIDMDKSSGHQENARVTIDNNHIDIIDEPHVLDIDQPLHEACEKENGGTANTPSIVEMPSELTQDCNQKHLVVKKNFEVQGLESLNGNEENADTDVLNQPLSKVSLASDEMKKSNTKLIEENERLKDMIEKLMKSGQEQLSAISVLSGRIKALEKRLSRKKKLKTKRCRTPSSESFVCDTL